MPELFIELFSEEIPARMQKRAEEDLLKLLREKLAARGLAFKEARTFSAPRRLGVSITDLPAKTADVNEEKKGPRVGAPEQAIQGFLKSVGLKAIGEAQMVEDKKGAFYVARIERAGAATPAIVQEVLPEIIRQFPWPKSMRSGASDLQWVRPLHNICCVFDGREVKIDVAGVPSEAATWGHRFHAPAKIAVTTFAAYCADLGRAQVVIFRDERKGMITSEARHLCEAKGLELVEDSALLEEVAGLAELPIAFLGNMDPAFLDLPTEVIRLSMRTHQKYFAVRDPKTGKLAPRFITVANVQAKDGGKAIAAGNARVLSARLNDARFFWDTDRKTSLFTDARKAKLEKIVFHQKLGSVWDKVERVKALAVELCAVTGADPKLVARAAELCKMDLVTETVGEFPELQGQIGRELYLAERGARLPLDGGGGREAAGGGARAAGEGGASRGHAGKASGPHPLSHAARDSSPIEGEPGAASIAAAIEDHYRPLGPNDRVPTDPVAVTLALADKLDTLVGFWAIDEKPTGSSDPYALRRAALGFVRIVLSNGIRFSASNKQGPAANTPLVTLIDFAAMSYFSRFLYKDDDSAPLASRAQQVRREYATTSEFLEKNLEAFERVFFSEGWNWPTIPGTLSFLVAFLADRLKVQIRDQGKRHDLVDAVFALGDDDLVRIVARVEALDAFLKTEAGANLLAGYKRAANILAAEEKKEKWSAEEAKGQVDASKLGEPAETALYEALEKALPAARAAVEKEDFAAAMKALADLRAPVDAFFDKVMVNADDAALRRNRLLLLARLVEATSAVADFSKIEG